MLSLIGCDFTSRPSKRKPITVAQATLDLPLTKQTTRTSHRSHRTLTLNALHAFESTSALEHYLSADSKALLSPWIGGFDFPFGLARELVETLAWPVDWEACMQHFCSLNRPEIREHFRAFCNNRPVGFKFAHRATDLIAKSSPSMKWVNPPVAYMMHAGLPVLVRAQVSLPGLRSADPKRVALEAYPGMLAREIIGQRSYKSDDRKKHTPQRLSAREQIVQALKEGAHALKIRVRLTPELERRVAQDPSGDYLDALLCAVQAAWGAIASEQGDSLYGLAKTLDPLEGWIVTCT